MKFLNPKLIASLFVCMFLGQVFVLDAARDPVAKTNYGKLRGFKEDGINVFRGIRYAKPPVGQLRFRAPQAPKKWSGIRDAKLYGSVSVQGAAGAVVGSEDCLYLNIVSPGLDAKKRPVLFWIHGGGFTLGSASARGASGSNLAVRGDVVVVTVNYRLGALGFLYLGDTIGEKLRTDPNRGLLDQIAALRWVRDNISAFGGDPDNVTIFGESAGSMSVGSLLAAHGAKGLFHKAICQSGASHMVTTKKDASLVAEAYLKKLNISPESPEKLLTLPAAELLSAQSAITGMRLSWGTKGKRLPTYFLTLIPVGDGRVLPEDPFEAIVQGSSKEVSVLIGTNLNEWNFFMYLLDKAKLRLDNKGLLREAEIMIPGHGKSAVLAYKKAHAAQKIESTPSALFGAIETDRMFRIPSIRLAEAQSTYQPNTFMYLLNWRSPAMNGNLGSCHAIDFPFVFGTFAAGAGLWFTGGGPEAKALSEKVQDAWISFAKTGNPEHPNLKPWPAYDADRRATMVLSKDSHSEEAPMDAQRKFWDNIL